MRGLRRPAQPVRLTSADAAAPDDVPYLRFLAQKGVGAAASAESSAGADAPPRPATESTTSPRPHPSTRSQPCSIFAAATARTDQACARAPQRASAPTQPAPKGGEAGTLARFMRR